MNLFRNDATKYLLPALAVAALAAGLRLYDLGERSLSLDECIMREVVCSPWSGLVKTNNRIHSASPLYPAIAKTARLFLPDTEFGNRLPACIFGILAVAGLALAFPAPLGTAGIAAAFLMAGAPMQLWLSRDDNGYSLLVLAAVLCCRLYCRMEVPEAGNREKNAAQTILWLLAGAEILAIWAHYQGVFVAAGLQAAYLLERRMKTRPLPSLRNWIFAHLAVLTAVVALIPTSLAAQMVSNPRGTTYLADQYFQFGSESFLPWLAGNIRGFLESAVTPSHHGSIWIYLLVTAGTGVFLLQTAFRRDFPKHDPRAGRRTGDRLAARILIALNAGLFGVLLAAALAGVYPFGGIRHVVFLTVPFYLAVGWALVRGFGRFSPIWVLALALIWFPGIRDHYGLTLYAGEHIRPLVELLNRSEDADPVYVYRAAMRAFTHYNQKPERLVVFSHAPFSMEQVKKDLARIPHRRFWAVSSHSSSRRDAMLEAGLAAASCRIESRWKTPGARLWRVVRTGNAESFSRQRDGGR
ncbi:MAG: hypothetical protein CSB33_02140 [Desulfobacterales bacterium]|nr:MAG: hypothetical protein CSB33_02140 [Desulfobacterales bacterium]